MNPKTLQYLMGHSEIGVTLDVYTHLGLEDAAAELHRMEELQNARQEMNRTKDAGGTAASDFTTVVATNRDLPFEWTEYTADLPEGTKRFAIHCISVDKFALFVDDVTYSVAAPSIVGYNIYVDGELVATLGADQITWTSTASGEHKYEVSVVYDKGESAPVEANASTGISLTTAELASPQDVYTADGRLVRRNATTIKGLPRGVYVVGNLRMLVR